jgi:hypothetical protein
MIPLLPIWALGWGAWIARAAQVRAPLLRASGLALAAILCAAAATPGVLLATSGSEPPGPFEPGRFALSGPFVTDLAREHVPLMNRLLEDPRAAGGRERATALTAFEAAAGGPRDPLRLVGPRCPSSCCRNSNARVETWGPLGWEYFGAAAAVGCAPKQIEALCATAPSPPLRDACTAGGMRR